MFGPHRIDRVMKTVLDVWPASDLVPLALTCSSLMTTALCHPQGILKIGGRKGTRLHRAISLDELGRLRTLLMFSSPETILPHPAVAAALVVGAGKYNTLPGPVALSSHKSAALQLLFEAGASMEHISGMRGGVDKDAATYALLTCDDNGDESIVKNDTTLAASLRVLRAAGATARGIDYPSLWVPEAGETIGGQSLLHLALQNRYCGYSSVEALLSLPGARATLEAESPLFGTPLASTLAAALYNLPESPKAVVALLNAGARIDHPSLLGRATQRLISEYFCSYSTRCVRWELSILCILR